MQGRKDLSPKIMYQVHLDMLVPQDNFYRKLDAALNLHFLYKATSKYYGSEGNESIDPVVFFKIILVGYFNNINSDRQLLRYCSNCLDVRLFLRYDILFFAESRLGLCACLIPSFGQLHICHTGIVRHFIHRLLAHCIVFGRAM
jgi:transposase